MSNRVAICPNCGFPLISTMAFRYAERYCMNCGGQFGMLDAEHQIINSKLRPFTTKANRRFGQIRKSLIGGGMRLRNCKKCMEGKEEEHLQHATKKEDEKYKWALKKLAAWKGSFEWRE